MTGRLIISLDFELMWGVRDRRSVADYGDAVLGVRQALPAMLERFERFGIRATWATVGLLFARNRNEMLDFAPAVRPAYANPLLSPYEFIETGLGRDEAEDPLYFGRSLLDRVTETEGQEIATHTFSHYYCMEPGQSSEAFSADLAAALAIADGTGHRLQSIVFPRNQVTGEAVKLAAARGLDAFRGNRGGYVYKSRPINGNTALVRMLRLADGAVPIAGLWGIDKPCDLLGATDVPASRFLRPWTPGSAAYSRLHRHRVRREMEHAARRKTCYHLWWHPHNMGRHIDANLAQLDAVLETFRELRDAHGMQSCNMIDVVKQLRGQQI